MEYATTNHLIIVCCHAIYNPALISSSLPSLHTTLNSAPSPAADSDASWLLAPFQASEPPTFIAHAKAGLELLAKSPETSLLVFSGSKTRPEVDKSEARSYLNLCEEKGYWGVVDSGKCLTEKKEGKVVNERDEDETVEDDRYGARKPMQEDKLKSRILLEEQALDSFSNILFSLLLFWKTTNNWPIKISIISHEFKRARFLSLHIPALRFPLSQVNYLGIDPEYMVRGNANFDLEKAEEVRRGERERGYAAWEADVYGKGEVLRGKRRARNFWGASQVWFGSEEERRVSAVSGEVLEWLGDDEVVVREEILGSERQPWESEE